MFLRVDSCRFVVLIKVCSAVAAPWPSGLESGVRVGARTQKNAPVAGCVVSQIPSVVSPAKSVCVSHVPLAFAFSTIA